MKQKKRDRFVYRFLMFGVVFSVSGVVFLYILHSTDNNLTTNKRDHRTIEYGQSIYLSIFMYVCLFAYK